MSPYRATRDDVRNVAGPERFVEVFVNTPLEVCEEQGTKRLYTRARRGQIKGPRGSTITTSRRCSRR